MSGWPTGTAPLFMAIPRSLTRRKIDRKRSPQRFTFSRPIYPDPEIRFSACVSASSFLFHKWRECHRLRASMCLGSLEGDRSVRVPFQRVHRRASRPWKICRGSGEKQRKRDEIPSPSRCLPHANAPTAGAGISGQCSSSSPSCSRAVYDLPSFLRGPLRAACIRTTCWVVNMNIALSST